MAAKTTGQVSNDNTADRPAWLDQVLGVMSPPFTFRNGRPAQQNAALGPNAAAPAAPARQRG